MQIGAWRNPSNLPLSQLLLAGGDGKVYRYDTDNLTLVELASGFTGEGGKFANAEEYVIFADGGRTPLVYDGVTPHSMGISKPTTPTASVGGSGSWSGTYHFAVTSIDTTRGVESVLSDSVTLTPSSQRPTVTYVGGDSTATHWNVYVVDDSDPNNIPFLINSAPIPIATTTYTTPTAYTPIPAPLSFLDNTPAPDLQHVAFFNGTYFGAIGNKLYWSKPLFPWAWPGSNVTTIPFEGNDTVMGMAALEDSLLIFGRRNIVLVTGYAPMFSLVRLDANVGVVSQNAYVELPGAVAFLSDEGVRLYPGLQIISRGINRELLTTPLVVKERAVLSYSHEEGALWLTLGGKTFALFVGSWAASTYTLNPVAVLSGGVTGFDANLLLLADGTVHAHDNEDSTLDAVWQSKIFQFNNPETTKYFRRIGLLASHGSSSNVTVAIMDTAGAVATVSPSSVDTGTIYWDAFDWDSALWSHEGVEYFVGALPAQTLVGATLQVRISGPMKAGTEIVPPLTLLYRESLRFLGR